VWLLERGGPDARVIQRDARAAGVPRGILGIAMIITYGGEPFWIGGSSLMVLAYLIRVVPARSPTPCGFKQVNAETEDAPASLGASWVTCAITCRCSRADLSSAC